MAGGKIHGGEIDVGTQEKLDRDTWNRPLNVYQQRFTTNSCSFPIMSYIKTST